MTQLPIKTKATYSWGGNKATNELGFMEDDVIEVQKVVNNSTYFGESQRTKLKGFFPSKYVELNISVDQVSNSSSPRPRTPSLQYSSKNNSSSSLFTLKPGDRMHRSGSSSDMSPSNDKDYIDPKSKKFTSSYAQAILDSSQLSTDTNSSSTFGHSDFSATSAGSYMRHKDDYEAKLRSLAESSMSYNNQTRNALNEIIEKNDKKHKPRLFKGLLGPKGDDGPSFDDRLYLSSIEKMSQMSFHGNYTHDHHPISYEMRKQSEVKSFPVSDLDRTKTVSGPQKARRIERVLREQPDLVLKPHEYITNVNSEERDPNALIRSVSYNLDSADLSRVDKFMSKVTHGPYDTPQKFTANTIMRNLKTEIEIARAIYVYLTRRFKLITIRDEKLSTKKMYQSERIIEIMQTGRCSSHQLTWLFYLMAETAGLEVEIIAGYLKHPSALTETITDSRKRLVINHSWISIKIDGEYRFIDVILGNPNSILAIENTDVWDINTIERFYFLTHPLQLLYTHSPRFIEQQHIVPPVDIVAQLSLPPLYPHALMYQIALHKFNLSIFHLKDFETYDFELEVPHNYLVQGKFKPYDPEFEQADSFVQYYHRNDKRIAHIQGIMSKNCPAGFVHIIGKNEFSKKWNLLASIPCFHQGKWKPLEWARRPLGLTDVDVYLKEPKMLLLKKGEHKVDLRVYGSEEWEREVRKYYKGAMKLALFDPQRRLTELEVHDGKFVATINFNERGSWMLGTLDLSLKKWRLFNEWEIV